MRLTWVVNDTFSTIGAAQQARARTAQVDAQKQQLIDSVRIEVTLALEKVYGAVQPAGNVVDVEATPDEPKQLEGK